MLDIPIQLWNRVKTGPLWRSLFRHGYPDSRIVVVAKYAADAAGTQQSGSLHKIIEEPVDGTGRTFRWERLAQGG